MLNYTAILLATIRYPPQRFQIVCLRLSGSLVSSLPPVGHPTARRLEDLPDPHGKPLPPPIRPAGRRCPDHSGQLEVRATVSPNPRILNTTIAVFFPPSPPLDYSQIASNALAVVVLSKRRKNKELALGSYHNFLLG